MEPWATLEGKHDLAADLAVRSLDLLALDSDPDVLVVIDVLARSLTLFTEPVH
jgi:hypothetical protein